MSERSGPEGRESGPNSDDTPVKLRDSLLDIQADTQQRLAEEDGAEATAEVIEAPENDTNAVEQPKASTMEVPYAAPMPPAAAPPITLVAAPAEVKSAALSGVGGKAGRGAVTVLGGIGIAIMSILGLAGKMAKELLLPSNNSQSKRK